MARAFVSASQQYLESAASPVVTFPFTASIWFRQTTLVQADLLCLANATTSPGYNVLAPSGKTAGQVSFICGFGGETFCTTTGSGYTANTWNHAAMVSASATSRAVFLNGAGKATDTVSKAIASLAQADIGGLHTSGSLFVPFTGQAAHVAIWNSALSDAEIATLAAGVSPERVRPENLVAYWPLWGTHSPEIELTSGGHSLTLVNGPTRGTSDPPVIPRAHLFSIGLPSGDVPLLQSAADSGESALEAAALALSLVESGIAADAGALIAALSAADPALGAEGAVLLVGAGGETGGAVETGTLGLATADSGAVTESGAVATAAVESSAGTDAGHVTAVPTGGEATVGAESAGLVAALPAIDSASAAESVAPLTAQLAASESGQGIESAQVMAFESRIAVEGATAADVALPPTVTLSAAERAIGTGSGAMATTMSASDSGGAADDSAVGIRTIDAAGAAGAGGVGVQALVGESAAGRATATVGVISGGESVTAADAGGAVEGATLAAAASAGEAGSAGASATYDEVFAKSSAEGASGGEAASVARGVSISRYALRTIRWEAEAFFGTGRPEITFSDPPDPWHVDGTGRLVELNAPDPDVWTSGGEVGWSSTRTPSAGVWTSTGDTPWTGATLPVDQWPTDLPWYRVDVAGARWARLIYAVDGAGGDGVRSGVYLDGTRLAALDTFNAGLVGRRWDQSTTIDLPDATGQDVTVVFESFLSGARLPWMNLDAVELGLDLGPTPDAPVPPPPPPLPWAEYLPRWMRLYHDDTATLSTLFGAIAQSIAPLFTASARTRAARLPQTCPWGPTVRLWRTAANLSGNVTATLTVGGETTPIPRVADEWAFMTAGGPACLLRDAGEIWMRGLGSVQSAMTVVSGRVWLPDYDSESDVYYRDGDDVDHNPSPWRMIPAGDPTVVRASDDSGAQVALPGVGDAATVRYTSRSRAAAVSQSGTITLTDARTTLTVRPVPSTLPNRLDSWAAILGLVRLDGESPADLLDRMESVGRARGGAPLLPFLCGVGRTLGLMTAQDWDGRAALDLTETALQAAVVGGVSPVAYARGEVARALPGRRQFVLTESGDTHTVRVDGQPVAAALAPTIAGRLVTFPAPVGKVEVDYRITRYTLATDSSGAITQVVPVAIPPGRYRVYVVRGVRAYAANDPAAAARLYNPDGTASGSLRRLAERVATRVPVTLGHACWGDTASWIDADASDPGAAAIPHLTPLPLPMDPTSRQT